MAPFACGWGTWKRTPGAGGRSPPAIWGGGVDAVLRRWGERDAVCAALERIPQAFGPGDGAGPETVAIDWEHAGPCAASQDIGQTLSVEAAFFDRAPAEIPSLDGALFDGYLAGLAEPG